MTPFRRTISRVLAWWFGRSAAREAAKLKARRADLIARIQVEQSRHRKVSHLFQQLRKTTTDLLRIEQGRTA